ncbi:choice-of-anchor Q domain-containing protein [Azohydromonas sediminis]|uniref:choice-of-anchor Q domain-containing protein n=1 Tax=Azohydromonas sediminis TaxID=2259674 RepID=UPI000E658C3A|nr:choice-of-anchor Q domain-containing protein [Azohydromonas sediminis]
MHLPLRLKPTALALAATAALCAMPTWAATLTADPTATDGFAGDDKCSLREAVMAINAGTATADCANSVADGFGVNDTINLPAGTYTLTTDGVDETYVASGGTVPWVADITSDASRGDLDITKSVKIVGAGSATTTIQWSTEEGQARDRIFHVFAESGTIDVQIQGVKLTNGQTLEEFIEAGPASGFGVEPTSYFLRRAGGAVAVGPAAAVVLVDPNKTGQDNAEGRGGSKRPTEPDEGGATFSLTLTDVIVDSNSAQGDGGGIYTAAAMTATNVVVSNNTSTTNGGGIYNEGNTTIAASTIKGNTAEGGGGFFGTGSNVVNIAGVTFSGNHAVGGGAISGRAGVTMRIVNSTISGNTGSDVGAGVYTNGVAELRFVTIANNLAGADSPTAGSGVNTFPSGSASVTLKNVLLAGNKKGWFEGMDDETIAALPSANCGSTSGTPAIESRGHNLSSDDSCDDIFTVAGDLNNTDPKLGPLDDNGGPTQTHALAADSPALGAGEDEADITTDQRGEPRDSPPDIGAFELPAPTDDADGGGGGGGCTTNPNAQFDGGLLGLLAAAFAGLALRRRRKA